MASTIAIIANDPQTPLGEKAQKEAKADARWVNHDPHGSRLYLLNVGTGKLMPLPVDPTSTTRIGPLEQLEALWVVAEAMNGAADLARRTAPG